MALLAAFDGPAGAPCRTGRCRCGLADRRAQPAGDRRLDRLLRQYPGPALGSLRNPELRRAPGRVRRTALDAFTHQDLPFEQLVEELAVERNLAVSPLFQVLFALQNVPTRSAGACRGWRSRRSAWTQARAKFDLSLTLQESPAGFVRRRWSTTRTCSTAARSSAWSARFAALLEAAVNDPSLPVADLPLLLPGERQQALVEWNDTRSPRPRGSVSTSSVAAQVGALAGLRRRRRRERASDLRRARRRANHWPIACASLGVGPEVLVGTLRWSARRRWSSRCWASSRRAAPTCRSIRPILEKRLAFLLEDSRRSCAADAAASSGPDAVRRRARSLS